MIPSSIGDTNTLVLVSVIHYSSSNYWPITLEVAPFNIYSKLPNLPHLLCCLHKLSSCYFLFHQLLYKDVDAEAIFPCPHGPIWPYLAISNSHDLLSNLFFWSEIIEVMFMWKNRFCINIFVQNPVKCTIVQMWSCWQLNSRVEWSSATHVLHW